MDTLKQAKEAADNIFQMTTALVFTGEKENEETEVEAYVNLLEEREPLIEELTDLRQQLDAEELASEEFNAISETISAITALDKEHLSVIKRFHANAKASYKDVKLGQRINAGYNPLPGDEVPGRFDVRH